MLSQVLHRLPPSTEKAAEVTALRSKTFDRIPHSQSGCASAATKSPAEASSPGLKTLAGYEGEGILQPFRPEPEVWLVYLGACCPREPRHPCRVVLSSCVERILNNMSHTQGLSVPTPTSLLLAVTQVGSPASWRKWVNEVKGKKETTTRRRYERKRLSSWAKNLRSSAHGLTS